MKITMICYLSHLYRKYISCVWKQIICIAHLQQTSSLAVSSVGTVLSDFQEMFDLIYIMTLLIKDTETASWDRKPIT